jgi:hypothetical protein
LQPAKKSKTAAQANPKRIASFGPELRVPSNPGWTAHVVFKFLAFMGFLSFRLAWELKRSEVG